MRPAIRPSWCVVKDLRLLHANRVSDARIRQRQPHVLTAELVEVGGTKALSTTDPAAQFAFATFER